MTAAIQGFGNVGSHSARLLAVEGSTIVAVSDISGGIANDNGLDIRALLAWVKEHGVVEGFSGAEAIDGSAVLTCKADVLIPAALEEAIPEANAGDVQAQIIVEAANGPLTAQAHDILIGKGVTVIPDILANAGGVTVSYFEWSQNIQHYRWEESRVVEELDKTMRKACRSVAELAARDSIDHRSAAFVLAIKRVARAAASRRSISQHLPPTLLD